MAKTGLVRIRYVTRFLEGLVKWTAYVGALVLAAGYVLKALRWGQQGPLAFVGAHLQMAWAGTVTASIVLLWTWVASLRRRFTTGFTDDFTTDPRQQWDFVGPWQITKDRELVVTGSDEGGVTKRGALWENYTLSFEAQIVNRCLGVIVRARDLDNYYMLQIAKDRINPHRRVAVPMVQQLVATGQPDPSDSVARPVTYTVGWQIFKRSAVDLSKPLDQWFSVQVRVKGESLEMFIDGNLVWQEEAFLKIPTGKIGFRNSGSERALVRKVRVRLDE